MDFNTFLENWFVKNFPVNKDQFEEMFDNWYAQLSKDKMEDFANMYGIAKQIEILEQHKQRMDDLIEDIKLK